MKRFLRNSFLSVIVLTVLLGGITACGQVAAIQEGEYYHDRVAVLMYHNLDSVTNPATITPAQFTAQLDMLQQKGFNVISIEDFGAFLTGERDVPPNAAILTFDDGYQSFYRYAYPELLRRKLPATVFIIVGHVGRMDEKVPKLSWQEMLEMQQHGMSFYSHTYDSHRYIQVNANGGEKPMLVKEAYLPEEGRSETSEEFINRVREDLTRSYRDIETNLGGTVPYLALPYGWADKRSLDIANEVGFKFVFTVKPGLNDRMTSWNALYRINAGNPDISPEKLFENILAQP